MNDQQTTIAEIKKRAQAYRKARGWVNEDLRDAVMGLVLEATEVLELVQWRTSEEVMKSKRLRGLVADELADVLLWLVVISDRLELDLAKAFEIKVAKQEKKYPVEIFGSKDLSEEEKRKLYYQIKAKYRGDNPIEK